MPAALPARHVRTLFISDVHLGTRGCQADLLLDFLRHYDAETIYLVGDIIDGWRLRRAWYWPQSHNDVAQKFLRKARKGARLVYVPGNHDEFLRDYIGTHFGGIEVRNTDIHTTADGRRLLVIHGDQFDVVVRHARWLAHFGDWAYDAALVVNTYFNHLRRIFGFGYWSLSNWGKQRVKNAVNFIGAYECALIEAARRANTDGVVCGHIHFPGIGEFAGLRYVNTGDWVESCSAAVEHHDGRMEIVRWTTFGVEQSGFFRSRSTVAAFGRNANSPSKWQPNTFDSPDRARPASAIAEAYAVAPPPFCEKAADATEFD